MTRHMIYNLCVLALRFGFAYLFRSINMTTMVNVVNLTGLLLLILPLISLIVPKMEKLVNKKNLGGIV